MMTMMMITIIIWCTLGNYFSVLKWFVLPEEMASNFETESREKNILYNQKYNILRLNTTFIYQM